MNVVRQLLFENLGLKLIALLLAVLVYLNVYTDRPATMLVSFPIEYQDLADSLTLSGPAPAMVQVELKGTGKQLIGMRVREPRVRLSLAGAAYGRFERALAASDLPLPPHSGITVENLIGPRVIALQIDRKWFRDVPVKVQVAGVPAVGFAWTGEALVDPARVRVTGPQHELLALDSLVLAPIHIDGKRDTVRADVGLEPLADWCTADPAQVRVRLPLRHAAR